MRRPCDPIGLPPSSADEARVVLDGVPGVSHRIFSTRSRPCWAGKPSGPSTPRSTSPATRALKKTQDVVRELDPKCKVVGDSDVAVVYVLGVGMRTHTGVARMMFGALAARGINTGMNNTSEVCIGGVVEKGRGAEAVACLREAFGV